MSRKYWFGYNGTDGGESIVSNYSLLTTSPGLCVASTHLCAIYVYQQANSTPPRPANNFFTSNIQTYITNGKAASLPQPDSFPKFVYVKQ